MSSFPFWRATHPKSSITYIFLSCRQVKDTCTKWQQPFNYVHHFYTTIKCLILSNNHWTSDKQRRNLSLEMFTISSNSNNDSALLELTCSLHRICHHHHGHNHLHCDLHNLQGSSTGLSSTLIHKFHAFSIRKVYHSNISMQKILLSLMKEHQENIHYIGGENFSHIFLQFYVKNLSSRLYKFK